MSSSSNNLLHSTAVSTIAAANKSTSSSLNGGSPSNKSLNSFATTTNNTSANNININNNVTTSIAQSQLGMKHWSQKKHESVIASHCINKTNQFLMKIKGGSDSGQFIYFDSSLHTSAAPVAATDDNNSFAESSPNQSTASSSLCNSASSSPHQHTLPIQMISGKLYPNEIILEIQGKKVSGFTLYDVISWLKQLASTYQSITFRTVKSASAISAAGKRPPACSMDTLNNNTNNLLMLPLELRTYLDERFQKGSIDYDLQQVIRENVYMRTVPCTTRPPRPGEIHGQDYIFLTNEQFLEMEQNSDLLEYGVYNGHYYGTPKPPREPKLNQLNQINQQQSLMNTKRNNSLNDMSSVVKQQQQQQRPKSIEITTEQLKSNNNNSHQTIEPSQQMIDTQNNNNNNCENVEVIPYGWEKVEDPEYGTFYIDHINKQTTYENPFLQQQQQAQQTSMKTFKPNNSQPTTPPQLLPSNNTESSPSPHNQAKQQQQQQQQMQPSNKRNIYFTQNPNELKGEFLKTSLLKTSQGFGFTIIGANETSEDFLQIKYIVPEGAAARDNRLKQGDVLVYVNNECVLGYTHQDVVEIFQSIPIGQSVELTVCRGYPLSIDPNDPNIEIMPLAAINNPNSLIQAPLASVDEMTASTAIQEATANNYFFDESEYYCEEYEELYATIVKGPKGFGFTIADDSQMNHQKVKQILDRERCCNLLENDILLEINGIDLRSLGHMQVVEVLKECIKGQETIIKLKRRKYQITTTTTNGNGATNGHSLLINTTNGQIQTTSQVTPSPKHHQTSTSPDHLSSSAAAASSKFDA